MTKPLNFEHLLWLDTPEHIPTGIKHGLIDMDTLEATQTAFNDLIHSLSTEWTTDKIREYLLSEQRKNYKSTAKYIQKLELDNRDARVRGVSYKDRQIFTAKIKTGYQLLRDIQKEVADLRTKQYTPQNLVRPSDMDFIQQHGFAEYLRQYVLGGYPLAVSPVKV